MKAAPNAAGTFLQKACVALALLIGASAVFNLEVPLPGAEDGGWRDNWAEGWNRGLDGDQAPANDGGEGPPEVAGR